MTRQQHTRQQDALRRIRTYINGLEFERNEKKKRNQSEREIRNTSFSRWAHKYVAIFFCCFKPPSIHQVWKWNAANDFVLFRVEYSLCALMMTTMMMMTNEIK